MGALLYEHPRGGPWSAAAALPGGPTGVAGPVVDAAGKGALGIAWRVDVPAPVHGHRRRGARSGRHPRRAGAGRRRRGRRRAPPALAIDPAGDALLAYHVATSATSTSIAAVGSRSPIAPPAAPSRGRPSSIGPLSSAPAVALGPDGTGIVAWTHDHGVYAVSVDADGRLGKVKRIASPGSVTSLVAAAGRDGAATLAWIGRHAVGKGRTARTPLRRPRASAGRRAAPSRRSARSPRRRDFVRSSPHRGRRRRPGDAGLEQGALRRGSFDRHQRHHERRRSPPRRRPASASRHRRRSPRAARLYRAQPSLTAARGRAWRWRGASRPARNEFGVQAVVGRPGALGPPQTLARFSDVPSYGGLPPSVATLAPTGVATVVYVASVGKPPAVPVVAAAGRRRLLISAPRGTAGTRRRRPGGRGRRGRRRPSPPASRRARAGACRTRAGRSPARPGRRRRGRRR